MARTDPRPNYGSKRRLRTDGYIDIYEPKHPIARSDGYVLEHRKIAWDAGLLTDPTLQVHHKDEVKTNNCLENFEVKTGAQHALDHAEERGFVTNQYGTFAVKPPDKRISAPKKQKFCLWCDGPISLTKRRDCNYCCSNHRIAHWKKLNSRSGSN